VRLGFDASIERQAPHAGTARYARELYVHMAAGRPDGDELVRLEGWPRWRPTSGRARPFRRVVNLTTDIGWLTGGSIAAAAARSLNAWFGPANSVPWLLPRPTIVTIHDVNLLTVPETYDPGFVRYATTSMRIAARRAARVITSSEWSRDQIIGHLGLDPARVSTVYPGLDHLAAVAESAPLFYVPRPYALFVGQTEPHKNIELLIDAWRVGVPQDLQLVVAGPPGRDADRLDELVTHRGLADRIRFTGLLNDSTLAWLYSHAEMFLFPSLAEGFGFPPLEAMARGIPTAVSDIPSLAEVTRGGAHLFDPHDPAALARLITEISEDREGRHARSESGRRITDTYRWSTAAALVWGHVHKAVRG